jgi:hypothetical protein
MYRKISPNSTIIRQFRVAKLKMFITSRSPVFQWKYHSEIRTSASKAFLWRMLLRRNLGLESLGRKEKSYPNK